MERSIGKGPTFAKAALLSALSPLVLAVACAGCELPAGSDGRIGSSAEGNFEAASYRRLTVVDWNVQSLFDGVDAGTEYEEFSAETGWTDRNYRVRLERAADALSRFPEGGADIIALEEIENGTVLADLAAALPARLGYRWTAFAANAGGALGLGLISRIAPTGLRTHSVSAFGDAVPRPILEARFRAGNADLALLICHWKSKLGGEGETEASRRASARAVARVADELARDEPGTALLVAGDLNENVDEFSRISGAYPTALLPDGEASAAAILGDDAVDFPDDCLVLVDARPPRALFFDGGPCWYDPWYADAWPGSYSYRGAWETIDHLLCAPSLFDGRGWEYASFAVAEGEPFTDSAGFPDRYDTRSGTGLSDHLPIMAALVVGDD